MDIRINLRDAALVTGGLAVGTLISFGLIHKAKKDIKNELLDKETKALKNEIKAEFNREVREIKNELTHEIKTIKDNIDVNYITKEIKQQIEKSIIDDTLREMNTKNANFVNQISNGNTNFMNQVSNGNTKFMAEVKAKLDAYEKELKTIERNVLDADARVDKLVSKVIRTSADVVARKEDEEDEEDGITINIGNIKWNL